MTADSVLGLHNINSFNWIVNLPTEYMGGLPGSMLLQYDKDRWPLNDGYRPKAGTRFNKPGLHSSHATFPISKVQLSHCLSNERLLPNIAGLYVLRQGISGLVQDT